MDFRRPRDLLNLMSCLLVVVAIVMVTVAVYNSPVWPHSVASVLGESRSPKWPAVRQHHLDREPCCAACGSKDLLNVHHVRPFHTDPALELEDSNLITLCEQHHLTFGHLMDWKSWNPDVRKDCEAYRKKVEARPYDRSSP